jgi:hypothetical protein
VEEELQHSQETMPISAQRLPQVENTLLSVWRRTIMEGSGPRLTLAEAASLLGSSVESVRRRIKAGQLHAYRDSKGRIRVNASVTYDATEDEALAGSDSETVQLLYEEMKVLRQQLSAVSDENERLLNDLQAAETSLEYTKTELANLWRVMTTRNARQAKNEAQADELERSAVLDFAQERTRIQRKISDVRNIARRRKWPWLQAG